MKIQKHLKFFVRARAYEKGSVEVFHAHVRARKF